MLKKYKKRVAARNTPIQALSKGLPVPVSIAAITMFLPVLI